MSSPKFRVAICGGGIGGLTLAVALGKYSDIPIDVYEAANEIGTVGAGLAVWKRTWDVMQSIGLEAEMTKRKIPLPQEKDEPSVMIRRADDPKGGTDLYQLVTPYGPIPLHRMHLVDMLRDLLPKTCTIHTSKRLSKYTHEADGSLTLSDSRRLEVDRQRASLERCPRSIKILVCSAHRCPESQCQSYPARK